MEGTTSFHFMEIKLDEEVGALCDKAIYGENLKFRKK